MSGSAANTTSVAPLLVFGWGNASRGDDALGPLFVCRLRDALSPEDAARIDWLDDYQLMPEHALDLVGRERVLLVDASLDCTPPFEARALAPAADRSVSTHALSPQALLQVYQQLQGRAPPPCTLLAIRGEGVELGAPASEAALAHLAQALLWARGWVGCRS